MKKVHQAGIGRGRLNPRQKTIEKKNRKQVTRYAMYLLTNVLQKKKRNKANFGTVKKAAINITTVLLIIPQFKTFKKTGVYRKLCLLYTSPSPRDRQKSRMPSSA